MEIVYDDEQFDNYFRKATIISPEHPILIDKFLENAIELDCDALSDGEQTYIGGIMEARQITVLPVLREDGALAGLVHMHDLLGKGHVRFAAG